MDHPHITSQSKTPILPLASFWQRVGAHLIDVILLNFIGAILSPFFRLVYTSGPVISRFSYTPSLLIGLLYFGYFWTKQNGQTLGAKALGIQVIRENGKSIDVITAIIRYVGYIVSGIAVCLGFLWIIWDKKKQGWHDKMAGTIVVQNRTK